VTGDLIPVLWLCGPPGVGKTAVGWEIFTELTRAGIEAGYVDIDQLGMCYPEPARDPGRYRMKERNAHAVVESFRAAGARCVIVSGVVDPVRGAHAEQIPQAALTVCRLRAEREVLTQRFVGRGGQASLVQDVLLESGALDASDFADTCVDIGTLPVAEVARLVRTRCDGWPVLARRDRSSVPGRSVRAHRDRWPGAAEPDGRAATTADGPILWLCGVTGAGKSTVGFQVYLRARRAGLTAAYIDLDQLGFCRPARADDPGNHRMKAGNLAALWQTYRAAGAQCLTIAGPAEDEAAVWPYTDALPSATITLVRLHAGRDQLTRRILLRGQGRGSWPQPGDPLLAQSTERLLRIADQAAAQAGALERASIGAVSVDTDRRTAEEVADVIVAQTGWPGRAI
jgi:adenylylsulfate kinase-like enzyme